MPHPRSSFAITLGVVAALFGTAASAESQQIARGSYLVAVGGCTDCHTPGHFLGAPDNNRLLGGSDVGFAIPGVGVFLGPNLTPDKETGLGNWSVKQIVTAITTGMRPDGRGLVPVMPYAALSRLTPADAQAVAAYLKSLPPVKNKVAGPFGPDDKPTSLVLTILPPDTYNALPKPPSKK
jgi:mono/diheme cytochrome c family protein